MNTNMEYHTLDKKIPKDIELTIANYGILKPDSEKKVMEYVKEQITQSRRTGANDDNYNDYCCWYGN